MLYLPGNKAKNKHVQILNVSIYCNQKYIAQQMTSHIISNKSYIYHSECVRMISILLVDWYGIIIIIYISTFLICENFSIYKCKDSQLSHRKWLYNIVGVTTDNLYIIGI